MKKKRKNEKKQGKNEKKTRKKREKMKKKIFFLTPKQDETVRNRTNYYIYTVFFMIMKKKYPKYPNQNPKMKSPI